MSSDSTILAGRRMMEALMESSCTIRRVAGEVFNETTGQYEETFNIIYTGKCRLKFVVSRVFEVQAADQTLARQQPVLSLPVEGTGSGDVRPNDVVTIDVNPLDGALVGVRLRIQGLHAQTGATARRFLVEVIS